MHFLFVHRAFPAQFGRLGWELKRRYGWRCTFLVEHISRCPTPSPEMLRELELIPLQGAPAVPGRDIPWPRIHGHALRLGQAAFQTLRARPDLKPDLVVGHGGLLPTLFLRDLYDCRFVDYCEYYFAPGRRDLTYRQDLPPVEPAPFFPRCLNATTLLNLTSVDAAYTPTEWQRQSFPERHRDKIAVHFDGIDTQTYRPRTVPRVIDGREVPEGTRVVTFVSRGLESVRGFDLFVRLAERLGRERRDLVFVAVGGDETHYGWDRLFTEGLSFREWSLRQSDVDPSRLVLVDHLEPEALAELLCLSDLHVYLTVPFVLSWSLLNAMACGCVVLASDVAPVREVVEAGRNGLLVPLFDLDRQAEMANAVLDDPAAFAPLGEAARRTVQERYSTDVTTPSLAAFLGEMGSCHVGEPTHQVTIDHTVSPAATGRAPHRE